MPQSAIASGCIDFVLAPEEIANKIRLIAYGKSRRTKEDRGKLGADSRVA